MERGQWHTLRRIVKKRRARLTYHLRLPVVTERSGQAVQQLGPAERRGWVYWAANVSR
jgi:hypothetical protein